MTSTVSSVPRSSRWKIRPATADDWEAIAALLSISSLPLAGAREHLEGFILAECDGVIVGCAAVERYGEIGLLRSVAVRGLERGVGIGVTLVEHCIAHARSSGIPTLILLTTTAERFFPRFGFRVVDRASVPDRAQDSVEFRGACPSNATVMRLDIRDVEHRRDDGNANGITIRPASYSDTEAIAGIYNEGILARTSTFETRERVAADIESWLTGGRYPVLIAERDGRVAGWIAASGYRARECYAGIAEFSVYVRSSEHRRRIGDTLMKEFLPTLESLGFWKVLARIFPDNAASLALCRRHGFREVGVYQRHSKLDGVWRDVVIVERLLGEATLP